ncbi:MAG: hypothetical protein K0M45_07900 [Candidatus Paracaedibacteraceae bacterium]|nr:hypothetical protein [Candidatus Paracaedibacteraceae bacterium]
MKSLLIVIGLKFILSGSVYAGPYYEPIAQASNLERSVHHEDIVPPLGETEIHPSLEQDNSTGIPLARTSLTAEKIKQVTRLYHGIMGSDFIFKQFDSARQARYMYDNFQYHQFNEDMAIEDIQQIILVIKIYQNKRR